ncbi:RING-H2 finger protein ATL78 [Sesamum alatum]|uniref:RING-type E3 ubiquitin transferase n=1 Tax=Sesamum alatum TaxID=300844 RepID=A0AAE1YUR8_9LAMI|nr:RING-H2 finger protein ATL78 [Sesamum alatum]
MDSNLRRHRLLLVAPPSNGDRSHHDGGGPSFDSNMVIILAALLCALICALGINSIVRFVLRCAGRANSDITGEAPPLFGRQGLKKELLRRIPVAVYGSENGVSFTDCPICLAEFLDGEKIRVLPKCHHSFHVRCVDIWLASHSSCPTCRQSLAEDPAESGGDAVVEEVE